MNHCNEDSGDDDSNIKHDEEFIFEQSHPKISDNCKSMPRAGDKLLAPF